MKSLINIKKNYLVKIEKIMGSPVQQERLQDLGFIPGTLTSLIAKLPFNGALACKIHGTKLAVRHEDAECILVSAA